jgi:methyltransferase (TIGR00027 family)
MPIEHVSDTARWVAFYRAMETERPDAIFRDPFARQLAGPEGERIVRELPRGRASAWAMITRTAVFDEIILDLVQHRDVDLVLNLAAGLDARPWRLPLPPSLRWVDVDLPAMLEYKASVLGDATPVCRHEAVPANLVEPAERTAVFSRFGSESTTALVVTEGLLIYLTDVQVGALARDLYAQESFRWWLIDLANPQLLRMLARSWGTTLTKGNAPFRFGPPDGAAFFRKFGWREVSYRSAMDEARRLHREMPLMWLWRVIGRLSTAKRREELRRMSSFVLLERSASYSYARSPAKRMPSMS